MFMLFRKSSHAPGKNNKSFLDMVSWTINKLKPTLPITNAMKSDFETMIDNCVADGAGEAIKFKDWDFVIKNYHPGNMGIPQAIIGGDPEIILIPIKIKCTHCQRIITDDDGDGCCSHCGAPIDYEQLDNAKWLTAEDRFIENRNDVAKHIAQRNLHVAPMIRLDGESVLPEPSHNNLPVRNF